MKQIYNKNQHPHENKANHKAVTRNTETHIVWKNSWKLYWTREVQTNTIPAPTFSFQKALCGSDKKAQYFHTYECVN